MIVSVALLAEPVVFWHLGDLAKSGAARLHPVIATFLLASLGFAAIVWTHFFVAPAMIEVAIASCLGLAIRASSR